MTNTRTFTSISSDNNVFDLGHVFRAIKKTMVMSDEEFMQKLRAHFQVKFSYLTELELANIVTKFLLSEFTIEHFSEMMDVLGVQIEIKAKFPGQIVGGVMIQGMAAAPLKRSMKHQFWDRTIYHLGLSEQADDVLFTAGIAQFGTLVQKSEDDMYRLRGMNDAMMLHIRAKMRNHGLSFGMDVGDWVAKPLPHQQQKEEECPSVLDRAIETLNLGSAIEGIFHTYGFSQVGQIVASGRKTVSDLPGIGDTRMRRIIKALEDRKLVFGMKLGSWKPASN